MKKILIPLFLILFLTACDSSDDSDEVTVDDFVGTWNAMSHTFTNSANSAQSVDIIALGGEVRMTVLTGGRARTWVNVGDFSDEWDSGFEVSGNTLKVTPAESSRSSAQWAFELNGNLLTLTMENSEFDFTLSDQPPTAAREVLVMRRN